MDVVDERTDTDFDFRLVESEVLPFEPGSFEIVISNHVIEHVEDQALHLKEIARVLRPGGVCYLATPNKLWPMEPHFHLPMLAWLPSVQLQDQCVRITGRGNRYDARLVSWGGIEHLASTAGLLCQDLTFEMAKSVMEHKFRVPLDTGRLVWPAVRRVVPSLVILLQKAETKAVASAN